MPSRAATWDRTTSSEGCGRPKESLIDQLVMGSSKLTETEGVLEGRSEALSVDMGEA